MGLSIVIPTFNEEKNIAFLLSFLGENTSSTVEIIVVDGNSTDSTVEIVKQYNVKLVVAKKRSRAFQMNKGAIVAKYETLYFLHADTIPPRSFEQIIKKTICNNIAGSFSMQFDWQHPLLRVFSWFTQFNWKVCRGGDRSLFIRKSFFEKLHGYREIPVMEDYEMVNRIVQQYSFVVLPQHVITSARRYKKYGILQLQLKYAYIHFLWNIGVDEKTLHSMLNK